MRKQAHTPQLLSLQAAMKIQCSQKEKKKKDIFSKNTGGICANIEGRRKHGTFGEVQIFSREKI